MLRDGRLLNGKLLEVLARAGHTDLIVIADAGLPIPPNIELIDLSVRSGVPSLLEVLDAVCETLVYERAVVAEEADGALLAAIRARLDVTRIERVTHGTFKELTWGVLAVVRTGEFTSYGNVGLVAGVPF